MRVMKQVIIKLIRTDVSTYSNQFEASREKTYYLTVSEFHRIATKYRMDQVL